MPEEVYRGARPPPPRAKRPRDDGDDANACASGADADVDARFALPSASSGVDLSMKMWTKEGERVSRSRPARVQYDPEHGPRIRHRSDGAKGDFNVWWGKHASTTGRTVKDFNSAVKAVTRCAPILDAGVTKGDGNGTTAVCVFFAQGRCTSGEACEYLHRLPTAFDDANNHMMYDIFGRPKHHTERDDNGGTGSYMRIGRTLYMFFGGSVDPKWGARRVYDEVSAQFGEFGPIEDVSVKFERRFAFVRYKFRASAEFAKEAMAGQTLWQDESAEPLNVRWANDDPNPIAIVRVANETEEKVRDMFLRSEKAQELLKRERLMMKSGGESPAEPSADPPAAVSFDPADYEDEGEGKNEDDEKEKDA